MAEEMVIDSSVAGKWFLKDGTETDTDLADALLASLLAGDVNLHAPQILCYELCGLLAKACLTRDPRTKTPRLTKDRALVCVRTFFSLPIQITPVTEEEVSGALEMAVDFAKGHYDMAYLRLAEELNCQWCTADAKVLKANPKTFPTHRVLLLSAMRKS